MNNVEKQYEYVRKVAVEKGFVQTERILPYVVGKHEGTFRDGDGKIPYVYHPLTMARHAIALNFYDDDILSTALLHDVCEDCGVAVEDLPVSERVRHSVALLTKKPGFVKSLDNDAYYSAIAEDEIATYVKILDRCNNISSMADGFTPKKMKKYANETEQYVYPLIDQALQNFPEIETQLFLIRYHMESLLNCIHKVVEV
ncbi:MAG: hypothetical protein Q4E53_09490 [Eubacteriales bacterium]|nr:hypothetical protein [Eubacteriales bacterium]